MFLPYIITQLITVWAFSSHHCVFFVFRLAFRAFSSFSSSIVPFLTTSSSSLTQRTRLLSSHNLHNSSHTAHLSQLNSHRSFYSTHLTQLNSVKSCFRVAFGGAAFVSSHRTSSKFFHTTHLITHSTHLTQLLSSHNSHNSTHSRAAFTYRYCTPPN